MPFTPEQEEKLNALLAEMDSKEEKPEPKAKAQDPIFKVNFGGKEITYRDNDDLQAQLAAEREQQIREAQAAAYQAAQQTFQQKAPPPKAEEGPRFDQDEYARLFVTDPVKAALYVDQFKPRNDEPIRQVQEQVANVAQVIATQQFLNNHPDYEATEANKQAILGVMQQANLPFTAQHLSMAYAFAKESGLVKAKQTEESGEEETFEAPKPKKVKAPSIPRKTPQASDAEFLDRFETLSLDKQRAYLESLA
jgi:hypothetical protein